MKGSRRYIRVATAVSVSAQHGPVLASLAWSHAPQSFGKHPSYVSKSVGGFVRVENEGAGSVVPTSG